jgi:predicted RNA-binding Zn-ribbon protein involved in translation (DUF1610 family)
MQHCGSIPAQDSIVHQKCPKCGARMFLVLIEPNDPGHEKRTYECTECGRETIELVRTNG